MHRCTKCFGELDTGMTCVACGYNKQNNTTTPIPKPNQIGVADQQVSLTNLLSDNLQLRKRVWLNHGCPITALYGDDGEMQCNCGPHHPIDFKRASIAEIESKLTEIGR